MSLRDSRRGTKNEVAKLGPGVAANSLPAKASEAGRSCLPGRPRLQTWVMDGDGLCYNASVVTVGVTVEREGFGKEINKS